MAYGPKKTTTSTPRTTINYADFQIEDVQPESRGGARIASYGLDDSGKTHFACNTPDPVTLLTFDKGDKPVVDKLVREGKIIRRVRLILPAEATAGINTVSQIDAIIKDDKARADAKRESVDAIKQIYGPFWQRVKGLTFEALESDSRTIVVDTGNLALEACRLAFLGKNTQNMPNMYGAPNADYANWMDMFFDDRYADKHVIVTHQMKKKYVNDKWNGAYEPAMHSQIPFLFNIRLAHSAPRTGDDKGKLIYSVEKCKHNRDIEGDTYDAIDWPFADFMTEVFPDTTPDEWE